jgi:hypothetical protein
MVLPEAPRGQCLQEQGAGWRQLKRNICPDRQMVRSDIRAYFEILTAEKFIQ